jgi:cation-transporting P-type ATPase I
VVAAGRAARSAVDALTSAERPVVKTRRGRAYLPVRGMHGPRGERLARQVERALQKVEGVRWAQVNPVLAQVAVSFDDGRVDLPDLTAIVAQIEGSPGELEPAGPSCPAHPADPMPISRAATALVADAMGLGVSVAGMALRAPRLPVEAASAVVAIDALGPVRRFLDDRPRAATATAVLSAALQGLGQGPLGLLVDGAHRASLLAELTSRRAAWLSTEDRLCGGATSDPSPAFEAPTRPRPLPTGLVERYAQASSLTALGSAAVTIGVTRRPRRAADVLLAGVPRAARLGVEGFAAQLGRTLAGRDTVVMDPAVLRRLDLIDTVVIDGALLEGLPPSGDAELDPSARLLTNTVREAAQDLVLAGAGADLAESVAPDLVVAGGDDLAESISTLQAEGRVVMLISHRSGPALLGADCGVGVLHPGEARPPWGADVICMHFADAAVVVQATGLARVASRQAATISGIGSAAAGILAMGRLPGAERRAVTAAQLSTLAAMGAGTFTATKVRPRLSPPARTPAPPWHTLDVDEALAQIGSGPDGLDEEEANARRRPDDSPAKPSLAQVVVRELANPLTGVLGAGAALAAATGSLTDAWLIGGVIASGAAIGAAQRIRTEAAIEELGQAISDGDVTVRRAGEEKAAPPGELVVGDIVLLGAGDAVPVDCRVIDSVGLEVDESSLTGESLPVAKEPKAVEPATPVAERSSMLYAGTYVAAGRGTALVVATGGDREAAKGGDAGPGPPTGVEARLRTLTDKTVPVVLAAGAGLTINGLLRGAPVRDSVTSGVSLTAAAVPEGLPFVATVAQASAAHRLAGSGVLVRNPQVLEALGRVDVLCFDKTGTLTEGRLRVTRVSDGTTDDPVPSLEPPRQAVLAAALRATPRPRPEGLHHPTDQAVVDAAQRVRIGPTFGVSKWKKVAALPFEPSRGYHAVAGESPAGGRLSVKGAPEAVVPRCRDWQQGDGPTRPLDDHEKQRLEAEVDRLAGMGLRVLAIAESSVPAPGRLEDDDVDGLTLLGFVGVSDEARSSAAEPLRQLQRAGIDVVMITGDHPSTAEAIASDLGLINGRRVMTGPQLESLDDVALDTVIPSVAVFARVTPADKVRIVSAFQRLGRVVAMTGDGANDAQAIRLAHVGVAFGSRSTPAAQGAADIVVARDDLSSLIETMIEGRAMWASVRDALAILLGGNLGEVVFTAGAALISGRSPLTARQLLAVNLFTDLAPAMAIAVQPPRSRRVQLAAEGPETSLAGPLVREVAIRAGATAAGAYSAWLAARLTGSPARARTVALAALVGSQLGQTVVIGRRSPVVVGTALLSAGGLAAVIQTPGLSRFFGCQPLGPVGWGIAIGSAAAATVASIVADALLP